MFGSADADGVIIAYRGTGGKDGNVNMKKSFTWRNWLAQSAGVRYNESTMIVEEA